jgi:hypothetical protein
MLPPMSRTEREALEAGTVWWDGELFTGGPDWRKLLSAKAPALHGSRKDELGRPFERVPEELRDRPVLLLHRNPLDTAVSFFFQVTRKDFAPGTLKHLQRILPLWAGGRLPPGGIDAFVLHPGYGVEAVCRFNRGWIDHVAGRDDSLIVTYEALRADPRDGFAAVLRFLGRDAGGVDALVEAASFENMRAREEARVPKKSGFLRPDRADAETRKVRRGKVEGYVDYLLPETVERARAVAARYGFEV